jgi:creatinine amidohydrolase
MLLQHATWPEVEAHLARSTAIVVPLGSTEQHGPVGAIGTDALCAEGVAARLAASGDILVAPTIALGVAQFNLAFPGTISLRATTLMAIVADLVTSLARQGFARFYFVNGHGGNAAPARAAFQDVYREWSLKGDAPAPRCRLRSWWEYPEVDALRSRLYGEWEGLHATPSEIAIVQALRGAVRGPALPPPERLTREFLRDHGGDNHWDAGTHRAAFPDGRVGSHSTLATPEDGRALLDAAAAGAEADYRAFLAEP